MMSTALEERFALGLLRLRIVTLEVHATRLRQKNKLVILV